MTPRRTKTLTLLAGILASALTLLAWTQEWFHLGVTGTDTAVTALSVPGSTAAPDLSALSLAGFALVAALAISGPALRVAFGVIQVALGAGVIASSVIAIQGPVSSSAAAVTKATGVSGPDSIAALVSSVDTSAWPVVAVILGVITAVIGIVTVFTVRRWPGPTRRYDAVGTGRGKESGGSVSDWDELSGGSDPTAR